MSRTPTRLSVCAFVARKPMLAGVFEVLLGIDFDVAAGGVDVREALAVFDHVLKEQDQVGFFEYGRLAPRSAGEFAAAAVVVFAKAGGAGGGEFGHANVFAMRVVLRNLPVNASYSRAIG